MSKTYEEGGLLISILNVGTKLAVVIWPSNALYQFQINLRLNLSG